MPVTSEKPCMCHKTSDGYKAPAFGYRRVGYHWPLLGLVALLGLVRGRNEQYYPWSVANIARPSMNHLANGLS